MRRARGTLPDGRQLPPDVALAVELETAARRGDRTAATDALARLETVVDALDTHLTSIRATIDPEISNGRQPS